MTIYNPGPYLRPAIDSLLGQSHRDFELIAIENGSTDGAKEIIGAYAAADPRIIVIDLPENIGRTPALNLALSHATGSFVAVLDADDLSRPQRLERQLAYLQENPRVVAVGSWCDVIDENGALVDVFQPASDPSGVRETLVWENPLAHSAVMYRRQAALAVGGYPADIAFAQDFALWQAFAGQGDLANLPEWLTVLRRHQASMTLQPLHSLTRVVEAIALFERAATLGGYSPEALRHGRRTLGIFRARHALLLCRSGRLRSGLAELARALVLNPLCAKDVPEVRRWTGVEGLSRRIRSLRPHTGHRHAGFTVDQNAGRDL